jgi:ABC-type bacteriocin/lantibiotic exporter with double-glycine peptidase domain
LAHPSGEDLPNAIAPVIGQRSGVTANNNKPELSRLGLLFDAVDGLDEFRAARRRRILEAFEAIYGVRLRVFKLKFGLKVLVSGLQSVGVFALLFVGGIMVLNGKTEIGIVVAFISGLDRVIDPWRELIAFVRSTSAAKVQFDLIEGTLGRKL